jgi:hypothetical protein
VGVSISYILLHKFRSRGSQFFFVPATPYEIKEKSDTPRKINVENAHAAFALLTEKKTRGAAWLYSFYSLQLNSFQIVCDAL